MADIYVRPYGEHNKTPWKIILIAVVIVLLVGGIWWWLEHRPPRSEPADTNAVAKKEMPESPLRLETKEAAPAESASGSNLNAQQLFSRAQSLAASGKLRQASTQLSEVISSTTNESLKNNALRLQGRINIQLFFSEVPTPEKKSYVIQPGDSLDKIARKNKTTIELIRRLNHIEGNLIYAGTTIQLPAAPFVIRVDKSEKTLDLMMNGKLFKRYAVGLGRYGKTPLGTFKTVVHQTNPDWSPPSGGIIPFGDPRNVLGTRWISIQDEARPDIRGFGIHGTSQRDSIGGETSNGCIRMLNEDVEELFMLIPRGTEVIISE